MNVVKHIVGSNDKHQTLVVLGKEKTTFQSSNERNQNKDDIAKLRSHHFEGEHKLVNTNQQTYSCNNKTQLTRTSAFNVDKFIKVQVKISSILIQLSEKIERLNIKQKNKLQHLTSNNKREQQSYVNSNSEERKDVENIKDDTTHFMIRQEVKEYSETISSVNLANKNKLSQIDEELKITIYKRSLGVITKDNELKEKESRYTKKTDINTKTINIAKKVKDVDIIKVNLRNGYRNVSTNEINIADGNMHKYRGQNESSGNK